MAPRSHTAARRTTRNVAVVAGVVVLATLAAACAQTGSGLGTDQGEPSKAKNVGVVQTDERPRAGGKVVYGLTAETNGWNPATNQWAASGLVVARSIFDTLATYDENSDIQPNLAESFTHNETYTEWTIHLRHGVVFHNGKPVNADAVARNQTYLKRSPITGGAYTLVDSISSDGDLGVTLRMKEPWTTFPYAMAAQIGVVAEPDWLESNDSLHPIGTGPFVLDDWKIGDKLVVKKNSSYWRTDTYGTRLPYLDAVEFRPNPDGAARANSLVSGETDMVQLASPDQIAEFQARAEKGEYQVFANTKGENAEYFTQLNTIAPPFDDVDARRALAYATDKQEIIDTLGAGLYEPADGPFAKGSRWYAPNNYPQFDPARARELVEAVKAKHGGRFEFELLAQPNTDGTRAAQYLQQMWSRVGIDASIKTMDQATGIIAVITGRYQAVIWQQFDTPHPIGDGVWWLPELVTPAGEFSLNFARNKDDEIGKALHAASQSPDKGVQDEKYKFVGQRLAEDVPYVWLYHTQTAVAARPRVVNVVDHTLPGGQKGLPLQQGSSDLAETWVRGIG